MKKEQENTYNAGKLPNGSDSGLFEAIGRDRKKRRRKAVIIAAAVVLLIAIAIVIGVRAGRSRIDQMVSENELNKPVSVIAEQGNVTTTVSGKGRLTDAETEKLALPAGAEIEEIMVSEGEKLQKGQAIASVKLPSVLTALKNVQSRLDELDKKLQDASFDTVPSVISAGVNGRVKTVYAHEGDSVISCMENKGALAVISMDGKMAAEIDAGSLREGETLTAVAPDGEEFEASVASVADGKATVLVKDDGPANGAEFTFKTSSGDRKGTLYIHRPLKVTGYAGTIERVYCSENQYLWSSNAMFGLKDTKYSANYDSILSERREYEKDMALLLEIYESGYLTAPFSGTVAGIDYKDPDETQNTSSSSEGDSSLYASALTGQSAAASSSASSDSANTNAQKATDVITLSKDTDMKAVISVNEQNILNIAPGQDAQITVNSLDGVFSGKVTKVNRSSKSENGVTDYEVEITLPKDGRMLSGMSANVVIKIEGVKGAVVIPVAAIQQTGTGSSVYLSYDEKTGMLGDEVPVVTGLSDGSMIEITEGISEGDTIWYIQYYDPFSWMYSTDGNAGWVEDETAAAEG
ncbi:MAG: HlyD family efflux transporter periplasmic adaptor subunit [Oscillospiraceae bacterium]|nr:HlyD family efflux transporter periplasmic adaptor subunit [Oscillospiraceae bacterium]